MTEPLDASAVDFDLKVEATNVAGLHNQAVQLLSSLVDESVSEIHFRLKDIRPEFEIRADDVVIQITLWRASVEGTLLYSPSAAEGAVSDDDNVQK